MTKKLIKYFTISNYGRSHHNSELNFGSRELANNYILSELKPKSWSVNVELNNLTITKKERVQVERERAIYYKSDPKRVKKMVKETVEEDKWTQTHNFEGYVSGEHKWREKINHIYGGNGSSRVNGYYIFKVGDITHEITGESVIFRAPVYVQFIKAALLITPEVKVDGQPYQARKEEVKTEVVSEWLPVCVSGGSSQFNSTKYLIDPNWSDGYWGAAREPYVAVIEYYVEENGLEMVIGLE